VSHVLNSKHVPSLSNEARSIRSALENPIASPSLRNCVGKNDKIVIITTDNTRPCPDNSILAVILNELDKIVPKHNITILIGLGLHDPLSKEELAEKLGERVVANYNVKNHDPAQTVHLGVTSFGTPVEVNSAIVEADFRISTGFIEPHFFAGYSGGRKAIAPGVSSVRAIRHNHSFTMIEHPNARTGILVGNPVHEDMVEQARMAKLDFIVNVLLNANRRITHIFAGNPWKAHEMGCAVVSEIAKVEIDHLVDISIISNSGAPLDLDFYQTCKGIDTASQITRNGGIIIVASACIRGLGPDSFRFVHASAVSPKAILETLKESHNMGVSWQNQILARVQLNHSIYLLSTLDDDLVRQMKVIPIHTIEEGLEKALQVLGTKAEIAVIPEGPMIIPTVKN
jgi:nickel-dependent lactate racemase